MKSYWKKHIWTIIIFALFGLILLFLPWLLTQNYSGVDLSNTGQIGDTIGGVTAPFIGFLAAILVYLAFRAQIDANYEIRNQFKVQKTNDHFYKMLDIHLNNVADFEMNSHRMISDKHLLRATNDELSNEYETFSAAFTKTFITLVYEPLEIRVNPELIIGALRKYSIIPHNPKFETKSVKNKRVFILMVKDFHFCHLMVKNANEFFHYELTADQCNELAYKIFFWGTDSNHIYGSSIEKDKVDRIRDYLSLIRKSFRNNKGAKFHFSYDTQEGESSVSLRFIPFSGHVSRLAHYFRHLYQTVKFLHFSFEDGLITKLELDSNLKVLRAQFTNEEVLLLYYNYRIGFGANWDQRGEHDYKFFRDFELLHNIPLYDNIPKSIEHPLDHFKGFINEKRKENPKFKMFEWQKDDWPNERDLDTVSVSD